MTARILPFVRAEHAGARPAVPSGAVPPSMGTVAASRPVAEAGSGLARRLASVSPMAGRTAPTTVLLGTWSVVGAKLGPVGVPLPRNTRPGHPQGAA